MVLEKAGAGKREKTIQGVQATRMVFQAINPAIK
jgi:hypothetical protein